MTASNLSLPRLGPGLLVAPYENVSVLSQEVFGTANRLERQAQSGESGAFQELRDRESTRQLVGLTVETRDRLIQLGELPADWDSYGALTPTWNTVARAGTMLVRVAEIFGHSVEPTDIMPIADGGIALDWRRNGCYLSVLAVPGGGWSSLRTRESGEPTDWKETYDLDDDDALGMIRDFLRAAPET